MRSWTCHALLMSVESACDRFIAFSGPTAMEIFGD